MMLNGRPPGLADIGRADEIFQNNSTRGFLWHLLKFSTLLSPQRPLLDRLEPLLSIFSTFIKRKSLLGVQKRAFGVTKG